jgi:hypothetical protein
MAQNLPHSFERQQVIRIQVKILIRHQLPFGLLYEDGDTCQQDPCAAAAQLGAGTPKTAVNVVAFDVTPEDQQKLACISEKSDGQFFLARNEAELAAALDQAINSTVPYNLKLSAQAGGMPLPFTIEVYEAGTNKVIRRGESTGTKLINLPQGTRPDGW